MAAPRLVAKHNLWGQPKKRRSPGLCVFWASSAVQYDRYHQAGGAAAAPTRVMGAEIEILEVALGLAVAGIVGPTLAVVEIGMAVA